jgi:hypothetical protein
MYVKLNTDQPKIFSNKTYRTYWRITLCVHTCACVATVTFHVHKDCKGASSDFLKRFYDFAVALFWNHCSLNGNRVVRISALFLTFPIPQLLFHPIKSLYSWKDDIIMPRAVIVHTWEWFYKGKMDGSSDGPCIPRRCTSRRGWCIMLSKSSRSIPLPDRGDMQPAQYDCCDLLT